VALMIGVTVVVSIRRWSGDRGMSHTFMAFLSPRASNVMVSSLTNSNRSD